jgi:transcriptional regulator with XRE-family HTH domain
MARVASPAAKFVGARIDERRLERGLTQDQLAAAADIDSANLRAYINGRAMPNVHSLVRISSVLEVALSEILDGLTPEDFPERGKWHERPDGK